MEVHQLRYFAEVARCGNFTRAAEACHVSQPSLSQQLRKLEEELGQPLIKRTRDGALLTEFGASMLGRAQEILGQLAAMQALAQESDSVCRGRLSISAIPTIAPYCLPAIVKACAKAYPGIELVLSEDTTDDLVDKIRRGQLDFGLLSPPFPFEHEMDSLSGGQDELLITLPRQHPLGNKRRLRLEDLAEHPIVLLKEVHCLRRQSVSLCNASGVKPGVSIESSQLETVISMVESGHGFSFTPAMAVPYFRHRRLLFRSLQPRPVSREISLIWQRQHGMPRLHSAFTGLVKDVLEKQLEKTGSRNAKK